MLQTDDRNKIIPVSHISKYAMLPHNMPIYPDHRLLTKLRPVYSEIFFDSQSVPTDRFSAPLCNLLSQVDIKT